MKNNFERIQSEFEAETNLVAEFETKYYSEIKEKEREKKIALEEASKRQEAETKLRKE